MITAEEYAALKFGDKVEILIFQGQEFDEIEYNCDRHLGKQGRYKLVVSCSGLLKHRQVDVFIPKDLNISSWPFTEESYKEYGFIDHTKYKGWHLDKEDIIRVVGSATASVKTDPIPCLECKEFYPWAEPNFDTDKLVCWPCRDSLRWKYTKDSNGLVCLVK